MWGCYPHLSISHLRPPCFHMSQYKLKTVLKNNPSFGGNITLLLSEFEYNDPKKILHIQEWLTVHLCPIHMPSNTSKTNETVLNKDEKRSIPRAQISIAIMAWHIQKIVALFPWIWIWVKNCSWNEPLIKMAAFLQKSIQTIFSERRVNRQ